MIPSIAKGDFKPEPSPGNAVEIIPIMIFSPTAQRTAIRDMRAEVIAVVEEAAPREAEAPADVDPKAVTSSATGNASDSGSDSSEKEPTHPSSLPDTKVDPVTAEKESSPLDQSSSLPASLGLLTLPV